MRRAGTRIGLLGLAAGALAGCYVVSPNAYPAYLPPPPAAPPTATAPMAPPPGPGAPSPSGPGAATRCETVRVEGHWETHVRPGRPPERVWAPAQDLQVCR